MQKKRVFIVGGGFGGLNAAKSLDRRKDLDVVLLDRRNHHLFQPLLYQVATAGLSPAEIAVPIRSLFSASSNTSVRLANVQKVDLPAQRLETDAGAFEYDYLILACGSKHSYFGHPEWEDFAPGLKTLEQATEIRRRVLTAFEKAECEQDPEKQKQLLTFVVVGAGPTGVELAGALGEISRFTLSRDFKRIDPARTRVILIEAGPRILASFSEKLARHAARDLEQLGVQIWTSSRVTEVSAEGVRLGGEQVRAATVLWAAGVQPSSLGKTLGLPLDKVGRVPVETDLSLAGYPRVFVIGDQAACAGKDGAMLPGLAPVAIQQGRWAASNLLADLAGKPRQPFRYLDKGQMATIGRKKAVAQTGKIQFTGFTAWMAWLFVHIYYLIGFKNRLFVLAEWAWAYLFFSRGARLIVQKEWRSYAVTKAILACVLLASPAPAAMNLQQVYEAALGGVESVAIQNRKIDQADEQLGQVISTALPSVNLLGSYQRQDSPTTSGSDVASKFALADQFNSRLTATQPIFQGFAEWAGMRGARARKRAEIARLEQVKVTLFSSVSQSYYSVLSAEQDRVNLETLLELTERRVKDLQERFRIGRSRDGELLAAQAQLAVLRSQLQAAILACAQARNQFALATKLERDTALEQASMVFPKADTLTDYINHLADRPDIRALRETALSSEESISVAKAGHFPSLAATGNYYLKRTGVQDAIKWDVGLTLTVPVFQGGFVSAKVSEAVSIQKQSELALAQGRRSAETELRNAFDSYQTGRDTIAALEEAARISEKNYHRQNQDYRLGLVTNLDVLQALNTFQETKRSLDKARYQTLTAWAALQAAVGKTL
ncbi:FAD-dependent oxidoreductase [bacterium]|nr:FAD-dependent oxidoreductase [bacterium]